MVVHIGDMDNDIHNHGDKHFDTMEDMVMTQLEPKVIPGWVYVCTFGYDLDLYAKHDKRRAVDRVTGNTRIEYDFKKGVPCHEKK